jgi:hypothetical protein
MASVFAAIDASTNRTARVYRKNRCLPSHATAPCGFGLPYTTGPARSASRRSIAEPPRSAPGFKLRHYLSSRKLLGWTSLWLDQSVDFRKGAESRGAGRHLDTAQARKKAGIPLISRENGENNPDFPGNVMPSPTVAARAATRTAASAASHTRFARMREPTAFARAVSPAARPASDCSPASRHPRSNANRCLRPTRAPPPHRECQNADREPSTNRRTRGCSHW